MFQLPCNGRGHGLTKVWWTDNCMNREILQTYTYSKVIPYAKCRTASK